jgi:hypothetical protein
MTTSNYITFILLGVIGLVFLIDFILNSRKKPLEKSVEKFVEKEKSEEKSSLKWLNWILDRKKNFTLSILIVSLLKLLTHFFLYRAKSNAYPIIYADGHYETDRYYPKFGLQDFTWHLEKTYIDTVWLFIPVTIVFLVVVWFFNDKIKAR